MHGKNETNENNETIEQLNDTSNDANISATDGTASNSAGAANALEDTQDARDEIIRQQAAQIDALMKHTESLNNQIAQIIRNGGAIGTPTDTGSAEPPSMGGENAELPDFDAIAARLISRRTPTKE